jgi:lipoprotein-anchoring transpeptidase ErfK/SrfK
MKNTLQKICYSGLLALFLVMLATFSPLSANGIAHARVLRGKYVRKVIVVSLSKQWLYVYENGQEVADTPVTTGRPSLPTPTGIYHIFYKASPITFHSSFPRHSPNWSPPTHIKYAMEWKGGGYFLHDAWWHTTYGPDTNKWHQDPVYGWQWGSHGCIAVPLDFMKQLYQWAPIGTEVIVQH